MGYRPKADDSDRLLCRHPIFVTSDNGECSCAALANILFFMEVQAESKSLMKKGALNYFRLSLVSGWLEISISPYRLEQVDLRGSSPDKFLKSANGFYLAQLYGSRKYGYRVNHVVGVVCDRSPLLVLDSVEPFTVTYSDVAIKTCAGGGDLNFVEEVRVLVKRSF